MVVVVVVVVDQGVGGASTRPNPRIYESQRILLPDTMTETTLPRLMGGSGPPRWIFWQSGESDANMGFRRSLGHGIEGTS